MKKSYLIFNRLLYRFISQLTFCPLIIISNIKIITRIRKLNKLIIKIIKKRRIGIGIKNVFLDRRGLLLVRLSKKFIFNKLLRNYILWDKGIISIIRKRKNIIILNGKILII